MLHKLRSLLTALGIIIGVGAVVALAAYGEGAKQAALADIKGMGANNIILESVKPPENVENAEAQEESSGGGGRRGRHSRFAEPTLQITAFGITRKDLLRLQDDAIKPVDEIVPLKRVGAFVYNHNNGTTVTSAKVYGTTHRLPKVVPMNVARGRHLAALDNDELSNVAVLGAEAAHALFKLEDPLGSSFTIDNRQSYVVVGVLESVGRTAGWNINYDIYIPIKTAEAQFKDDRLMPGGDRAERVELSKLIVSVPEVQYVQPVAAKIRRVIEVGHPNKDVLIEVPLEQIRQTERTEQRNTQLMIVIAALSLIVGGIGIMNIMLASVTERVREIGVRRALGATRMHIVAQFLVETTVLSVIGGIVGTLMGLSIIFWPQVATIVIPLLEQVFEFKEPEEIIQPVPVPWSIFVGFGSAVLVGLLAGVYPAIRAAWQDPIVALRHD